MNNFAEMHRNIADDLVDKGWSVQTGYMPKDDCLLLLDRIDALQSTERLTPAGIGREDLNQLAPDIRRDKTFWLERANTSDQTYLSHMQQLRLDLNRDLFLGLFEYEAHYAVYPAGGFYKKHLDALKGEKNRIVSTVLYLNKDWQVGDGGELALYHPERIKEQIGVVQPHLGTCVFFLSEDIPHEVLPACKARKSIAGWFRCNASSADKVDPLR